MKHCVDCNKHFLQPYSPHHFCKGSLLETNVVTGTESFAPCAMERAMIGEGHCGKEARYFEQKLPEKSLLERLENLFTRK